MSRLAKVRESVLVACQLFTLHSDLNLKIFSFCLQLSRKHREGHLPKVDWLDRLTFREIHQITDNHKRESNSLYMMIEFPRIQFDGIDYSVVYFEKVGVGLEPSAVECIVQSNSFAGGR
jgi:hypothetical protein